jgi:hypothetical protein
MQQVVNQGAGCRRVEVATEGPHHPELHLTERPRGKEGGGGQVGEFPSDVCGAVPLLHFDGEDEGTHRELLEHPLIVQKRRSGDTSLCCSSSSSSCGGSAYYCHSYRRRRRSSNSSSSSSSSSSSGDGDGGSKRTSKSGVEEGGEVPIEEIGGGGDDLAVGLQVLYYFREPADGATTTVGEDEVLGEGGKEGGREGGREDKRERGEMSCCRVHFKGIGNEGKEGGREGGREG